MKEVLTIAEHQKVIEAVSNVTHVPVLDIVGKSRKKEIVTARHMSQYFLHEEFGVDYQPIADTFECDRTNIYNSVDNIKSLFNTDSDTRWLIRNVREQLRAA